MLGKAADLRWNGKPLCRLSRRLPCRLDVAMTKSAIRRLRWVTFDCFGTLVDWHTGFSEMLRPIAGEETSDLLRAYHRIEPQVVAQRPFQLYRDLLSQSLRLAAREISLDLTERQARMLPEQWAALPVFSDVEKALAGLRAAGCKIGVLTNCDEDLFAQTQRSFQFPFDRVVTAEQVRDYKPSLSHFRFFEQASEVHRDDWVHVACSWFHDIAPARELGIKRIWLDRDNSGEEPSTGTLRVLSARALPAAVMDLCEKAV
jgi:2-haloacid dehalogenase